MNPTQKRKTTERKKSQLIDDAIQFKSFEEKACEEQRNWINSIGNHLWWSSATCEQNELVLKEKLISLLFDSKTNTTGQDKLSIINVAIQIFLLQKNAAKHGLHQNPCLFLLFKQ